MVSFAALFSRHRCFSPDCIYIRKLPRLYGDELQTLASPQIILQQRLNSTENMNALKTCDSRGALIVFEGCDRCGKSTQSNMLVSFLQSQGIKAKHMNFPERSSHIGQVINNYLKNKDELSDECIHLLFSANRWEFKKDMKKLLEAGATLVVDRYSYSGVAYSVAKGLDYEWSMASERGLIKPDAVFYLRTCTETLSDRGNYGEERYEKKEFQRKVSDAFNNIFEKEKTYWHDIDANLSIDNIHEIISKKTLQVVHDVNGKPLKLLD